MTNNYANIGKENTVTFVTCCISQVKSSTECIPLHVMFYETPLL